MQEKAGPKTSLNAAQGSADPTPPFWRFAGFTLDVPGRVLTDANGREVPLRRSEFGLLLSFIAAPRRVLSRDYLLSSTSGRRAEPFDRSIDVLTGQLRRKIEPDPKQPRLILTVPGVGYKFAAVPEATSEPAQGASAAPGLERTYPQLAERRQITVLRCDLVETAMAPDLDPEDLYPLLADFHARCTDIIGRFGGTVAGFQTDGVLAYFGYPQAHEHDPERAIRAGIALIEAVSSPEAGPTMHGCARVGIATGPVLAGDLLGTAAGRQHAVIGKAPALAARLVSAAQPGSVVISRPTHRLIGGLFTCRALSLFADEDHARPVPAFQVIGDAGAESRFAALHEQHLTPLAGREEELALLLRRWAHAKAGAGRVVQIIGEPGIGKSRLIHELRAAVADEPHRVVTCFCAPDYQGSPFHPFIRQIERAAGIDRTDAAAERLRKLESCLGPTADPATIAAIADLLSIPVDGRYPPAALSPRQRRENIAEALIAHVVHPPSYKPVLFLFEDAHWIDPSSREVLELLSERIRSWRVLAIVTVRSEFAASWPGSAPAEVLVLNRLVDTDVAEIIAALAGASLPLPLRRLIIERADGVPLYVEELTKSLIETATNSARSRPSCRCRPRCTNSLDVPPRSRAGGEGSRTNRRGHWPKLLA